MSGAVPGTLGGPMFGRGRVEQQKTHSAFISARSMLAISGVLWGQMEEVYEHSFLLVPPGELRTGDFKWRGSRVQERGLG